MDNISEDVQHEYQLKEKANQDGWVYVEVQEGMCGSPQAGLLAKELLGTRLAKHGYEQSKLIPGLWTHKKRPIKFCLVHNDYGVKYVGGEHAEYLKTIFEQNYKI